MPYSANTLRLVAAETLRTDAVYPETQMVLWMLACVTAAEATPGVSCMSCVTIPAIALGAAAVTIGFSGESVLVVATASVVVVVPFPAGVDLWAALLAIAPIAAITAISTDTTPAMTHQRRQAVCRDVGVCGRLSLMMNDNQRSLSRCATVCQRLPRPFVEP
jgi:hypothetical protein